MTNSDKREQWAAHRDATLTRWQRKRPGHRPAIWWELEAPEPRRRLGGTGTPWHECFKACRPAYEYGLPMYWLSDTQARYHRGEAVDIHGQPIGRTRRDGTPRKPGDFAGVALDPENPPTFESEAAYLDRLGLLTDHERGRLTPGDFEPVQVRK